MAFFPGQVLTVSPLLRMLYVPPEAFGKLHQVPQAGLLLNAVFILLPLGASGRAAWNQWLAPCM